MSFIVWIFVSNLKDFVLFARAIAGLLCFGSTFSPYAKYLYIARKWIMEWLRMFSPSYNIILFKNVFTFKVLLCKSITKRWTGEKAKFIQAIWFFNKKVQKAETHTSEIGGSKLLKRFSLREIPCNYYRAHYHQLVIAIMNPSYHN